MKGKSEVTGTPINEKIRFEKVQVISNDGRNLGVLSRNEALRAAMLENLDLVLMSEQGNEGVPVVKIMDFGKALYAKKKQQAEAKKHQKVIQIKEIKMRPKIGEHDFRTKIAQGIDFLKEGKYLKVSLIFRGREAEAREVKGSEMYDKINALFAEAGLTRIAQEKDLKGPQFWTRVYFLKSK